MFAGIRIIMIPQPLRDISSTSSPGHTQGFMPCLVFLDIKKFDAIESKNLTITLKWVLLSFHQLPKAT